MSSTVSSELEEIKTYHENGELRVHCFKKGGKKYGECKWYYNNGELSERCIYKDGVRHGEFIWYRDNGELFEHCFFKDGKRYGEYKWYRENGDIDEHCFYVNYAKEELSDYIEDPDNITDDEFMNLSMVFGNNFFASKTFIGAAS